MPDGARVGAVADRHDARAGAALAQADVGRQPAHVARVGDRADQRRGDGELEVALDLHPAQDQLAIELVLTAGHIHDPQRVGHAHGAGKDLADIVQPDRLQYCLHRQQ